MPEFKPTTGEHEFERTLERVQKRLPADVLAFALTRCVVVAVGEDIHAQTLEPNAAPDLWIIVLRENEREESIVAHEIAHAWLGHRGNSAENEQEARAQVLSWGFSGPAADR